MPDFSKRSTEIEIMDDLKCSGDVVDQTLRELEKINTLLGGNHVTVNGVAHLLKNRKNERISVTDLGCGGGDMLRLLHRWSVKKKYDLTFNGIDANPFIIEFAKRNTSETSPITFESLNIFSQSFRNKKFDIVIATLFFHHFTNDQLSNFFADLKRHTRIGFIVNDIHRHWFAYYSIKWLTQMFSTSSMVKNDGPLSVLRAFKKDELIQIFNAAGITKYTIRWMWAFRWQVIVYCE